jgi:AmmeMemoRadiSam system protein A
LVKNAMDPYVALAKHAVERYVLEGIRLKEPYPLPHGMERQAGAFVSIYAEGSKLRGCIGTMQPTQPNLASEIILNAIGAATRDPRFPPVSVRELPGFSYKVDILSPLEPISGWEDLDPRTYGVVVVRGSQAGLLLPGLEGIDDPYLQVAIAAKKAGIERLDRLTVIFRFTTERHT